MEQEEKEREKGGRKKAYEKITPFSSSLIAPLSIHSFIYSFPPERDGEKQEKRNKTFFLQFSSKLLIKKVLTRLPTRIT